MNEAETRAGYINAPKSLRLNNYLMYRLYILKCSDSTLYTGITTDIKRRIGEHNCSPLGAKYTRGRRPVKLVYSKKFKNKSLAAKEEARIKKLSRKEKINLVKLYETME